MSFNPINPFQRLTKKQIFQLFWYMKMVIHQGDEQFDYLRDFHVNESYIYFYNDLIKNFFIFEGSTRQHLQQQGFSDIDDADIKNVLLSLQLLVNTPSADANLFCEENIRNQVTFYIEWYKYFSYQYDTNYYYQAKPVIWDVSRQYDDYTIAQLERGRIMELFVDNEMRKHGVDIGFYYDPKHQGAGESSVGIEIKHDMKSAKTGNYYIEYAERHTNFTNQNFIPSGILKNTNTRFWIIGIPEEYYIVKEVDLQNQLYSMNPNDQGWQDGKKFVATKSSLGFIIKRYKLQEIAIAQSISDFLEKISLIA